MVNNMEIIVLAYFDDRFSIRENDEREQCLSDMNSMSKSSQ